MPLRLVFALVLCLFTRVSLDAQINPNGMYFMRNLQGGAPTSFSEWFTVRPIPGLNRYALRDFFGYGWNGTILPNGAITIDGGAPGSFLDADHFDTQVGGGPSYIYSNNRVIGTGVDFPVLLPNPAIAGDEFRAGVYPCTTILINAESSTELSSVAESVELTVTGTRLRMVLPNGNLYDGLFVSPTRVAIRVITNTVTGWVPQYASYSGTFTNVNLDVVGVVDFHDDYTFTAILCRQTRNAIGVQSQSMIRLEGDRTPLPLQVPGDFNQNGELALADIVGLLGYLFQGQGSLPCAAAEIDGPGNLQLLDANGGGEVDIADVLYLLGYLFLNGPPHTLGTDCVAIVGCETLCP